MEDDSPETYSFFFVNSVVQSVARDSKEAIAAYPALGHYVSMTELREHKVR
jgi:hypothetical protein